MTIKDIAELSGYGIGTVSRVINNHPDVSEKARKKILEVIEESNYEPNSNARMLKMKSGSAISIIVKGNLNMLFADLLERIQMLLLEREEMTEVMYIDEDGDEVDYAIKACKNGSPKAICFLGANFANFDERVSDITVPSVVFTSDGSKYNIGSCVSSVFTDDYDASREVAKFLVERGHRHIGMIGGQLTSTQISFRRYSGFVDCLKEYGIEYDDSMYEVSRYDMLDGYKAAEKLLERHKDITAIYAFADTIAMGVKREIIDLGMKVPDDISLVGFDGISIVDFSVPRLTTIKQNTAKMAEEGVDILLKQMHYPGRGEHRAIPFKLIKGDSVKNISE